VSRLAGRPVHTGRTCSILTRKPLTTRDVLAPQDVRGVCATATTAPRGLAHMTHPRSVSFSRFRLGVQISQGAPMDSSAFVWAFRSASLCQSQTQVYNHGHPPLPFHFLFLQL
jgi:hypothetical protein